MKIPCRFCAGTNIDHAPRCPVLLRYRTQKTMNLESKKDYSGQAPNIFIGRYGYPKVNMGILNAQHYEGNDEPLQWSADNTGITDIVNLRTQMVNSRFAADIKPQSSVNKGFFSLSQELSLAQKAVDVEMHLAAKPHFNLSFSQDVLPHGPNSSLKQAQVTENIRVPRAIDRVVSDTDLKAADALRSLTGKFDEHYLTKILSVGNLGVGKNRKLVPTRWAITATDDTLGKQHIKDVQEFKDIDSCEFYFGSYLENYYMVLLIPDIFRYELFEMAVYTGRDNRKPLTMTDWEDHTGRHAYAAETSGGYYAPRLAIVESLKKRKKRASVLALRFMSDSYNVPLGVWVTREATRKALANPPIRFDDKETLISYAKALARKKFGVDLNNVLPKSKLLQAMRQVKLTEF